jgi:hypothetical protein
MKLPVGCEAVGGRSIPIAESDLPDLLIAFEGDKLQRHYKPIRWGGGIKERRRGRTADLLSLS